MCVSLSRLSDHNLLHTGEPIIFACVPFCPVGIELSFRFSRSIVFFLFSSFDTHIVSGHIAAWIGKRVFFCFNRSLSKAKCVSWPYTGGLWEIEKNEKNIRKEITREAFQIWLNDDTIIGALKLREPRESSINETFSRQIDSRIIRIQIVVQTCSAECAREMCV